MSDIDYDVPEQAADPVAATDKTKALPETGGMLIGTGWIMLIISFVILMCAYNFDTSVVSSSSAEYPSLPSRVTNLDLQQKQMMLFLSGLTAALIGAMALFLGSAVNAVRAGRIA